MPRGPRPPTPLLIARLLRSPRHFLRHRFPSPSQLSFWARNARYSPTLRSLTLIGLLTPTLFFIPNNVFQIMWISGRSMAPFLNTDFNRSLRRDVVVVNMWRSGGELQRGDVVAFWTPGDPERLAVKRVVGVEGDGVRGREGSKRRNKRIGRKLEEQELEEKERGTADGEESEMTVVPQGHIWVEGDNPESRFTFDSNNYGPLARNLVVGRVVAGLWPKWVRVRAEDWGGCERVTEGVVEWTDQPHVS